MNAADTFNCARAKLANITREQCARLHGRANMKRERGATMDLSASPCKGCQQGAETATTLGIDPPIRLPAYRSGALRSAARRAESTIDTKG